MPQVEKRFGMIIERDVPVPMRDGVVLRANVFRPDTSGRFPALLTRTPYGKAAGGMERYVRAGYVVVTQDVRGRYASDGQFTLFTVPDTGDAEDGYDTVEWLARQPYCNGRVGTMGPSYNAWMQWQLAKLRPPHLVAMNASTIPLELTEVDWCGAFRPGRRVKWWMTTIAPDLRRREGLPKPHTPAEAQKIWDELERGRWLGLLPWIDLVKFMPKRLAEFAEDWLRHPNRRPWGFDTIHQEVEVPNLDFSGWYDHCNGTMAHLGLMQRHARTEAARTQTKLIINPGNHGGFGPRKFGDIDFGPQAEFDMHQIILRWFDYWLKGVDNGIDREPACRYFVMGSNEWRAADTWPPPGLGEKTLFLHSSGRANPIQQAGWLNERAPGDEPADQFTYDPRDPVPTLWTAGLFTYPSDRRRLEYRSDILYYLTEPLEEELEVVGYPEVVLYAATSAPDTDFFARLVDDDPAGQALEVCYGMVRCRHRHTFEEEELVRPGEVFELRIKLGATACRFLKGHRIRLEITSSDFPNHDRNHNTGKNDLLDAELRPADQTILHSAARASRLILPVLEG